MPTEVAKPAPMVRQFSKPEILAALKRFADNWLVIAVDGVNYWCDGSAIIACEDPESSGSSTGERERWEAGIQKQLAAAREHINAGFGYSPAPAGPLVGSFERGYYRRYSGVHLQERYVRAFGPGVVVWVAGESKPVIFTNLAWELLGVVMPVVDKKRARIPLAATPEIPFLEDEVLYHDCEEED